MKKLALLLGALSLVSSVAYAKEVVPAVEEVVVVEEVKAAPMLRVTSVGQEIEIDNTSGGSDIGEEVYFYNNVGLAYGDNWTFGLSAAKIWNMDTDEGIHSADARLELDAWYQATEDLALGFRFRSQKEFDRYYARYSWSHGMLWSAGDFWYHSNNGASGVDDNVEMEWYPVGVQYGPVKVGYFINAIADLGGNGIDADGDGEFEKGIEHQIRAYATLYKGEKITVSAEGRFTLTADADYHKNENGNATAYLKYDDFGRNRIYLGVDYAVNENLNVWTKYGYEFRNWTCKDLGDEYEHSHDDSEYYGEFYVGWRYSF